ncbi:MAG: 23S rRNA (uracil(1939)-C(5))-methyltransferase RlmD [Candidatus Wallbacteria bacterium]|nr:23S rRNA (uracil(1939)-C(5))-methyltransferase RlmD [Candidatus Wallbacteria bacterium]
MEITTGSRLKLEVLKFANLGYGLAKLEGFTIFIPEGIPGDLLEAGITELKKNYAFARIRKIVSPSPFRKAPPCPAFPMCGGCDYLSLEYTRQLFFKNALLNDMVGRSFKEKPKIFEITPSPEREFRHKVNLKYSVQDGKVGFFSRHSNSIVPMPEGKDFCLIQPKINEEILRLVLRLLNRNGREKLREITLRNSRGNNENMVIFHGNFGENDEIIEIDSQAFEKLNLVSVNFIDRNERLHNLVGEPYIREKIQDFEYLIGAGSFFQTNPFILELMLERMELTHSTRNQQSLDLYCGLGTFSFLLARNSAQVTAIEQEPESVQLAERNAVLNQTRNVKFLTGKVRKRLAALSFARRPGLVVTDPPRKGMAPETLHQLIRIQPETIIYISCQLPTFIRDAQKLAEMGYRFVYLYPFDMFPHTFHVEVMGYFTRQEEK